MSDNAPYDDYVMDHIRNARNFRVLDAPDHSAQGSNPLCGDDMTVYVKMAGERIADVSFQCTCCGISMASASMMTELVKGARAADARELVHEFVSLLSFAANGHEEPSGPQRLAMLETVRRFPSRGKCAVLPWVTLGQALARRDDPVVLR